MSETSINVPTDEHDGWTTVTSRNGNKYTVRSDDPTPDSQSDGVTTQDGTWAADHWIQVNWPVQHDYEWRYLSEDVKNALGIERYRLRQVNGLVYKYQLDYIVIRRSEYNFEDAEGDAYKKLPAFKDEYSLAYNSKAPTIVRVR